ncbi:MAG: hypothetical protein MR332_11700 [Fusicatenibacter sp.]|nr:hypothetical protein [Fusicatenibacter sp.]
MNRNRKRKTKMMSGIAVGMAAVMVSVPVSAAAETNQDITKEETVYVNADAAGEQEKIIVSNWLKNAGSTKTLLDKSDLKEVKNVKGDETFRQSGNFLTWQTDGQDIYYQGTSSKELPVSVKLTYYLDGEEISPEQLSGKSGKLKIKVEYTNCAKTTAKVNGKETAVYSPFVMVTGMILPDDTFSNVKIDNGKVISDGSKSIVVGIGMPGMSESLGLEKENAEFSIILPESLEITADVENFSMGSTFTVALTDLLDDVDTDQISSFDDLKASLEELEEASLKLVDGSLALLDGADELGESYESFDEGIGSLKDGADTLSSGAKELSGGIRSYTEGADALSKGIQIYLGGNGVLTGNVKEYVNGVSRVVSGVKDYTDGAAVLSNGVTAYVDGEQELKTGAEQLRPLIQGLKEVESAIEQLSAAADGKDDNDILSGARELSCSLDSLNQTLQSQDLQALLQMVDDMTQTGYTLIEESDQLGEVMEKQISGSVQSLMQNGNELQGQLFKLQEYLQAYLDDLEGQIMTAAHQTAQQMTADLQQQAKDAADSLNSQAQSAIGNAADTAAARASREATEKLQSALDAQIAQAESEGNTDLANALKQAKETAGSVSVSAPEVSVETVTAPEITEPELSVSIPQPELTQRKNEIQENMQEMKESYETLSAVVEALIPQMEQMQEQLDSICEKKEIVERQMGAMQKLNAAVEQLDAGGQNLYQGIAAFSANLGQLNESTKVSLPMASEGIASLLEGFGKLDANSEALKNGAVSLREKGPVLVQGVSALDGGTKQLVTGLNQLSTQLVNGAMQLSGNSKALRSGADSLVSGTDQLRLGAASLKSGSSQVKDGISQLRDGAQELSDGMQTFDEEGTGKLKETFDEKLGDILDRISALNSDECSYTTYSGRADEMDGSVKFIIETAAIEAEE